MKRARASYFPSFSCTIFFSSFPTRFPQLPCTKKQTDIPGRQLKGHQELILRAAWNTCEDTRAVEPAPRRPSSLEASAQTKTEASILGSSKCGAHPRRQRGRSVFIRNHKDRASPRVYLFSIFGEELDTCNEKEWFFQMLCECVITFMEKYHKLNSGHICI